jgi:hypothetical protein
MSDQEQQPERIIVHDISFVPPRVDKAFFVLGFFYSKESPTIAGGPVGVHVEPGMKLTPAEECVRGAACDYLEAYFQGKAENDDWDKMMAGRHLNEIGMLNEGPEDDAGPPGPQAPAPPPTPPPAPRNVILKAACHLCHGQTGNVACLACRGEGLVALVPASMVQEK